MSRSALDLTDLADGERECTPIRQIGKRLHAGRRSGSLVPTIASMQAVQLDSSRVPSRQLYCAVSLESIVVPQLPLRNPAISDHNSCPQEATTMAFSTQEAWLLQLICSSSYQILFFQHANSIIPARQGSTPNMQPIYTCPCRPCHGLGFYRLAHPIGGFPFGLPGLPFRFLALTMRSPGPSVFRHRGLGCT